ncbi:hypothetical protein [Pseudomonas sp. dw_358]|uniref:hypothetical protein n=1 Tax=Pseudomonas sp. dw_358 TaxID=2720083 RepID=UPI001BD5B352|nr:hypothetical protein [Pseudomonas sp. dw_358]
MPLTTYPSAYRSLSLLKRWRTQVNRTRLTLLFRAGVLLCLAASLQAAYYQFTLPTVTDMQITTGSTEQVRTQDAHVYALAVRLDDQLISLSGVCSGYRKGEANLENGEPVKAWVAHGEVYQLQKLNGETYRPRQTASPCSLFSTMDTAVVRPKIALGIAALGALIAVFSLCVLAGGRVPTRNSPA